MRDTIYALATAPGRAALAIVRVSGPASEGMMKTLCGAIKPRRAALRKITDGQGDVIDEGLVLWFPGPTSFTGEDVLELHLHGGPAVVDAMTQALDTLGGRPAEPGEFTRRAFEAGRLELSQAEAVADLVDAETEAQRRQALGQLGGALAVRGEGWRSTLIDILAFLSAQIDFPDDDLPDGVAERALAPIATLRTDIETALSDVRGERIRDGLRVALVGAPNAGKSSLLNALLGREAAIVTSSPGTTRDVIEATLVIKGYKVLMADTAGLRDAFDEAEIEGVRRAQAWGRSADLRLWLVDPEAGVETGFAKNPAAMVVSGDVLVLTKNDLGSAACVPIHVGGLTTLSTSTVLEEGLDELRRFLERWVVDRMSGDEFPAVTRVRHRSLLEQANNHLGRALGRTVADAELIAEDVRLAARALERLSGRLDPEDILDRVFSAFCIGK